jgi:subtilisin family serine protease
MTDQPQLQAKYTRDAQAADEKPYPPYYYLWHLCALGVLRAERAPGSPCPEIVGTLWDDLDATHGAKAYPKTTVAMIDVGVGTNHPNLAQVDMEKAIDLVTHRYGARRRSVVAGEVSNAKEPAQFFRDLTIEGIDLKMFSDRERAALDSYIDELRGSNGVFHDEETLDAALPSHGTAVAGLVVGDPGFVRFGDEGVAQTVSLEILMKGEVTARSLGRRDNVVPYFGVDPFSRLVPIKTSFDADPWPLIAAFLYAVHIGADVILLPRDIPDPKRGILQAKSELIKSIPRAERALETAGSADDASALGWTILSKLLVEISKTIPIVCAAGNSGESQLIYPASLAGNDEPNGIIAVGAVNALGCRAGYSNYGKGLTVVAPSDDGEVYNRHQARIDYSNPATKLHEYGLGSATTVPYSHYTATTTDLPGAWGYAGGTVPYVANLAPENNPGFAGGYYTAFGGTSAAAALTAGVVALMNRAYKACSEGKGRLTGIEAKELLMKTASMRLNRFQSQDDDGGEKEISFKPDPMNSNGEVSAKPGYFFGAGLVDAGEALDMILSR